MKYGYVGVGVKESELIQNYQIIDDKIIITYLDGSQKEKPFTKENEKKLLCEMLRQAIERSKSPELYNTKKSRKDRLSSDIVTEITLAALLSSNLRLNDIKDWGVIVAGAGLGIVAIISILSYISKSDKIKELEKYDIYLEIKKQLENSTDPNLFNGVKNKEEILNINTLDHYSLKDIKRIRDNLTRYEASKESKTPIYTKK